MVVETRVVFLQEVHIKCIRKMVMVSFIGRNDNNKEIMLP